MYTLQVTAEGDYLFTRPSDEDLTGPLNPGIARTFLMARRRKSKKFALREKCNEATRRYVLEMNCCCKAKMVHIEDLLSQIFWLEVGGSRRGAVMTSWKMIDRHVCICNERP